MKANTIKLLRFTGFAAGAVLAFGLVLSGRMPPSQAEAPARLSISSKPTPELGVAPAGARFLDTRRLLPGRRPASGTLTLSNYTGRPLAVRLRATSPQRDLDPVVRIAVQVGRRQVFNGPLATLRSWSRLAVRLRARQRRQVQFRAWVPMSVKTGYEARSAEVELEWKKARS
jgi:hypothetical protein